ncbi:MAG: class I SAM-dependent DNA methyltransferase [Flavobacteriaceae bacterium]|nr:class I SAM-dependent DNA methyltransferase [Flavobacteriaceae bacterium]
MTSKEIEQKLALISENYNPEEFIFDFLLSFGISKTTIARLKKGDFNMSKNPGEILYKGKIFYKKSEAGQMLFEIENLAKDERLLKQKPRFIILTDDKEIVAKDLKTKVNKEFPITELSRNYAFFLPLTGAEIYRSSNDNKADRDASYELAKLYDILVEDNGDLFEGNSHNLNVFLSRLLFCFFAEDTGIFEKESIFSDSIANYTREDGSDVDVFFTDLFKRLNTKDGNFPAYVSDFPYVNGGLFQDDIICPKFSRKSREILLNCGNLNWDEINPDIFGSMIQAVADPIERSDLGMHYTSVPNIKKLIEPLFLDELYEEFEKNYHSEKRLYGLINRMAKMKFFDPACGSGNFLIITYKELRLLEIKIIQRIMDLMVEDVVNQTAAQSNMVFDNPQKDIEIPTTQARMSFAGRQMKIFYSSIQLSQFYGIEIKDFAHEMAMLSLWLSEHQMNKIFETELMDYGKSEPILPLKESGKIVCDNAARMDWTSVCPRSMTDEIYIIGNPPYLGARMQNDAQKEEMDIVFSHLKKYRDLDYISIWFYKGVKYIEGYNIKLGFVSTNSIFQGQQVSLIWSNLLNDSIEIEFAHQSFKWINSAKGNAGVTVVIVGIRNSSQQPKFIFNGSIKKEVKNINGYLIEGSNSFVFEATKSISNFEKMNFGNMPNDGGGLIFSEAEKDEAIENHQNVNKFIKEYIGSQEFLNGFKRYCLWIEDEDLSEALENEFIINRIATTKNHRLSSKDKGTNKLAERSHQFRDRNVGLEYQLIIPRVSSERREYIPMGFLNSETVVGDSAMVIYDAQPWLFGVLHSKMHMVWVDAVGGKLKTDYRYSAKLCYNTFPFPPITEKDKQHISEYVFAVLDERSKFPEKTMAWLYNPDTMPSGLKQAHKDLDLAIERIYRLRPFESDAERLEFLFKMYDEMTKRDTLFAGEKKKSRKK